MSTSPFSRISEFYDRRVAEYGHDLRACDYGHVESQSKRFHVLSEALDYTNRSVLDIGCGFADYSGFLSERYAGVNYSGIDLSERMISIARASHPELNLSVGNFLEMDANNAFDVVIANGIFYLLGENAPDLMRQIVTAMFERSRVCAAFSSLSTWADAQEPGEYHADPLDTLAWCRLITPWVTLRHDYLGHDFTIYMHREAVPT